MTYVTEILPFILVKPSLLCCTIREGFLRNEITGLYGPVATEAEKAEAKRRHNGMIVVNLTDAELKRLYDKYVWDKKRRNPDGRVFDYTDTVPQSGVPSAQEARELRPTEEQLIAMYLHDIGAMIREAAFNGHEWVRIVPHWPSYSTPHLKAILRILTEEGYHVRCRCISYPLIEIWWSQSDLPYTDFIA